MKKEIAAVVLLIIADIFLFFQLTSIQKENVSLLEQQPNWISELEICTSTSKSRNEYIFTKMKEIGVISDEIEARQKEISNICKLPLPSVSEKRDITRYVQDHIKELQFPKNCSDTRFLICQMSNAAA
jgi:hypothetical protein